MCGKYHQHNRPNRPSVSSFLHHHHHHHRHHRRIIFLTTSIIFACINNVANVFPSCYAASSTYSFTPFPQRRPCTKLPLLTLSSSSSSLCKTTKQQNIHSLSSFLSIRGGSDGRQQQPVGSSSWTAGSTAPSRPGMSSSTTTTTTGRKSSTSYMNAEEEKEMTKEMMNAFLMRDDRQTFIARVYAILSCQLVVTSIFVFLFGTNPNLRYWMITKGRGVPIASLILSTICTITLSSSLQLRRSKTKSFQLLTLFTICESIVVGFITSFYKFQSVISAMLLTACSTLSITMYTLLQKNPKYDLSLWGSGLSSCAYIFLMYGILRILELYGILPAGFLPYNEVIFSLLGACLFSFYLAYHTRLIVSGKYTKIQMNEKDYVLGAMCLYSDIINMFIYILRILGEDRD